MSLNIKNPEAYRLARELAGKTGENLTVAVTIALRERLERHQESSHRKSRLEVLTKFSERSAPLFKDGRTGQEMIEDLYDPQTGLPK